MRTKVKKLNLLILLLILLHCSTVKIENKLTVIPQPSKVEHKSGSFGINADTKLLLFPEENGELKSITSWFSEITDLQIQSGSDINLNTVKNVIILTINKNDKKLGSEG